MDVQTEDNKSANLCGICGNSHKIYDCTFIPMKIHVADNVIPTKARLTLPDIVRMEKMSEGSDTIAAAEIIEKGTRFGPFEAKKLFTLNPEILFPLKLFTTNDYFSEYYLDTSDENECNWMMFVPPAQNLAEQNLICYQENLKIYFMSIKDIPIGEFLKVWYSPFYAQRMNKEVLVPSEKVDDSVLDLNSLLKKQQNLMERDVWTCKFCNSQEKDVTKFATHISQHYSMQVRKACEICKSVFMTHKGLKKHIRIVHANKSSIPVKEYKENLQLSRGKGEIRDTMLGGPLLNDVITDSMDNTNLLLQQTDISRFDMNNIENNDILLDNDNLNLAMENFIQDDDNFNFNIDGDKEEHVCDICLKPFAKLKCLIQHLQKHTGKYTCSECLVIFSRNENLKAHKCNIHKKEQYKCTICEKKFVLKKYLSRHILSVHEKRWQCPKCNRTYYSDKEFREHSCTMAPDTNKEKYPCLVCSKTFSRESYVKKHMKLHAPMRETVDKDELFICEICAKTFKTGRNLRRHKKIHVEFTYSCDKCDKKFTRQDTLSHHVIIEHSSNTYSCPVCEKSCKSQRYLRFHMAIHTSRKKHNCSVCNRKFFEKSNLSKHIRIKHKTECELCQKGECVHVRSLIECYECPVCERYLKLRSSVVRHVKKIHPNVDINSCKIKKVRRMCHVDAKTSKELVEVKKVDANIVAVEQRDDHNNMGNLNVIVENEAETEIAALKITNEDNTGADFSNLNLQLSGELSINNAGICLSMPELGEIEEDVTLSDNAYVLENGTIVEPLDSENVVVYIFDKK